MTHLRELATELEQKFQAVELGQQLQAIGLGLDFQAIELGPGFEALAFGRIDRCDEYQAEGHHVWAEPRAEWAHRAWRGETAAEGHRGENPWWAGAS